jgi:serine/threonine protein kinase
MPQWPTTSRDGISIAIHRLSGPKTASARSTTEQYEVVSIRLIDWPGSATAMIGTTVTHYRVLRQIGAGGMGVVYLAEDTR